MAIEALPVGAVRPRTRGGVSLTGGAAQDVRDTLGMAMVETAKSGRVAMETTYRLVPSDKAAAGMKDGTLRWADAKKGDASVLIKNKNTGKIAGQGELVKVRPSPAKVLGPAAWEAMAMATQQHYLVEINEKLEGMQKSVDEVLARMDDDKLGTLSQIRKSVESSRERIAEGKTVSPARRQELQDGAGDADEVWHQLQARLERQLDAYKRGEATAEDIERSWALLMHATQVLGETSALLTSLPFDTVEALEEATSEERERVMHALDSVRGLAHELHDEHLAWATLNADWGSRLTRNPARKIARKARGDRAIEPKGKPLSEPTAVRVGEIAAPQRAPAALLVTVNEDGSVEVAAESAPAARDGGTSAAGAPSNTMNAADASKKARPALPVSHRPCVACRHDGNEIAWTRCARCGAKSATRPSVEELRERAELVGEDLRERAGHAGDELRGRAGAAGEELRERAGSAGDGLRKNAEGLKRKYEEEREELRGKRPFRKSDDG